MSKRLQTSKGPLYQLPDDLLWKIGDYVGGRDLVFLVSEAPCIGIRYFTKLFVSPEMQQYLVRHWTVQRKIVQLLYKATGLFWKDLRDLFSALGFPVFPARGCSGMPECSYRLMSVMGRASLRNARDKHVLDSILSLLNDDDECRTYRDAISRLADNLASLR